MGSNPIPGSSTESMCSGDILNFLWELKKRGYKETTIEGNYAKILRNLNKHSNLNNPESVIEYVAKKHVSSGRKELIINCYINYCRFKGLTIIPPRYKREDRLPYVPLETDIEALISALPLKPSIFTKAVKETGARPGELWNLRWIDVDLERNTIAINFPEKGSRARILKVSSQAIALISRLPRKSQYVFKPNPNIKLKNFQRYFLARKKKIAERLCNPKLQYINWKSLRHYKGTMEYHKTKDILYVKEILGHKNIQNTLVYTHLVNFESNEFVSSVARDISEASKLVESGFEYVATFDNLMLFRKRK